MKILTDVYKLSNGVKMPKIGFGTWQIPTGKETYQAVSLALKNGYRHLDTAYAYGNEASVGEAVRDSKIAREEVFVTSKLPAEVKDYESAVRHFNETMKNLDLEYLDLYLIHAPWPWSDRSKKYKEGNASVWQAMIEFYQAGKIKAIGVSNFDAEDIDFIVEKTGFIPHVNQIPFFIGKPQKEIREYCKKNNILIEAYSPLGIGYALKNSTIIEMAKMYEVTPAQLCIRYCLEQETAPLPKSVHEERIIENSQVDFKIKEADLALLEQLEDDPRRWN